MNKEISPDLLQRFLNDQCSPQETLIVYDWINSFENDDDYISGINQAQQLLVKNKILNRVLSNINEAEQNDTPVITERNSKIRKLSPALRWIAAASVVLIAFLSAFYFKNQHTAKNIADSNELSFVNKTNAIYKLTLPDRSSVWLTPKSAITYPIHFLKTYRLISMNGECFFEITKGPKWPFVIQSRHLVTKVWGTSFRIRDNADLNYADVAVITGKVSVRPNRGDFHNLGQLAPGEVMLYPKQKGTLLNYANAVAKQPQTNNEGLKIWGKLNLSFEKATLRKMIPLLEKQFNVQIAVTDPEIYDEMLNADLNDFNLPDILTVFEQTLNVKYSLTGNTITLSR